MFRWEVLLAVGLTLAAVPGAQAAGPASCDAVTDGDAVQAEDHYARVSDDERVEGWEEANGVEGLQTEECEDANGRERSADADVVVLPDSVMPAVDSLVGFAEFLVDFVTDFTDQCHLILNQHVCFGP